MRMTRSSVLEVLRQDFIKTVRAKGASERVAISSMPCATPDPIITLSACRSVPCWARRHCGADFFPAGLGQMTLTGINQRDYPVVQGCVLFIAFVYVLGESGDRLLYAYIDPRISYD